MIIKFKNADERKKHPQAGLIPDDVWNLYFNREIDDRLLDIMTSKQDELFKKIQNASHLVFGCFAKEKIFAAVVYGHLNLTLDTFDEIFRNIRANSIEMLKHAVEILTANVSNNDKYLKHTLTQVNNKEVLVVAFCCAAKHGHLDILRYLADKALPDLQDMIKADDYAAFRDAAENGHVYILKYLEGKILPQKDLQTMIEAWDYAAFRSAALNGHLNVLEYLEEKVAPNALQAMIQDGDYMAFYCAARNGHLDILKHLANIAPNHLQAMIKESNYAAFRNAAAWSHLNVLEYLEEKVTSKAHLQAMIEANNYETFRCAAKNGHLDILKHLADIAPNSLQAMVRADDYAAFKYAAEYGHLNVLIFLMHYNFVRNNSFYIMANTELSPVLRYSSMTEIKELFKHPAIFEHACSHNQNEIKPFIAAQLQELKTRKVHGNPLHLLHNKQEAECLFYLLHHLIERVGTRAKDDILFLLSIPELQAILPTQRPPQNTTNLALRAAIIKKSGARRDGATWDEVIEKLYAIPAVYAQAEIDGHYQDETRGQFDLRAIANNTESSMQALIIAESSQLEQLREHYQPIYGAAGHTVAWMHVINCFENYYHEHQATFTNAKGEVITLPLKWDDFQKLNLSPAEYDRALKAYYTSPLHTAYRFFLRPNPWLASDARFVEVVDNNGGKAAKYSALKEDITVLTFAAFDKDIPPLASSGFTLEGRINIFCESIALIARGHNWDKTKEVGIDAKGNPIRAQYDDLKGDNPSCAQGMQKRLMQSLMAHPLFISIDAIAAEAVRDELHNIIKTKLAEFEYDTLKNLYQSLYDVAESIGSQSTVELTFNNDCYATLIANILKKYHWVNREMLNNAIQQELQALGLIDKKHQEALDKNLFLVGDLYIYTKNHICYIAEQKATPLILVTKYDEDEEDALETKELTDLDKIKRAISSAIDVCFKNQPLGEPLQSFITAANKAISIEELKSIWAKWTPSTAREHNFARDLEITYPDVFATKIIADQMTYENLPDWYQELTQEEQAQRRQQNSPSATTASSFFQPPPPADAGNSNALAVRR